MSGLHSVEDLLRSLAPQVLGVLVRRMGDFDACEDAVQEALIAAARHWPEDGVPGNPRGWLLQTATRRYVDQVRSEQARQRREERMAQEPAAGDIPADDDTLMLLFMCCHPALTPSSAIALTLRAVGGLATSEIAGAYLVPEATMAQRISRAKQRVKASGPGFEVPEPEAKGWAARLRSVLHVLYLMFNEGYATTCGPALHRADLSGEAIRLARQIHRNLPGEAEATGLLALMLLTEARLHGAALPDSALDLDRLRHYATTLTKFDTFSGVIRGPISVYEALTTVLGTMRASPLRLGNAWTVVRDEPKAVRKHVITRRQILKDSTQETFTLDLSDGSSDIIVEWLSGGDPRRRREHRVTFGPQTLTPRRMQATGAVGAEHAIHLATWAAATTYFRRSRRGVALKLAGRLLLPTDKAMIDKGFLDPLVTVLLATLIRGLVETAACEWRAGEPPSEFRTGLLRMAACRASRSGLDDRLLHPLTMHPEPAETVARALLAHVRGALEESGDLKATEDALDSLMTAGNGACVQRDLMRRTGSLRATVTECVRRTRG